MCRIRNSNTCMGRVVLVVVALSSSPTRRRRFVAHAPDLETNGIFSLCCLFQSNVLRSFPGELCAFHTHYEMGRNAFKKTRCCWNYLIFCLFLAEISLLSLSPALAVAVAFGEATHFWVGRSRQFVPAAWLPLSGVGHRCGTVCVSEKWTFLVDGPFSSLSERLKHWELI